MSRRCVSVCEVVCLQAVLTCFCWCKTRASLFLVLCPRDPTTPLRSLPGVFRAPTCAATGEPPFPVAVRGLLLGVGPSCCGLKRDDLGVAFHSKRLPAFGQRVWRTRAPTQWVFLVSGTIQEYLVCVSLFEESWARRPPPPSRMYSGVRWMVVSSF